MFLKMNSEICLKNMEKLKKWQSKSTKQEHTALLLSISKIVEMQKQQLRSKKSLKKI